MATDARLSVGLASHPKTKKLIRRVGASAGGAKEVGSPWPTGQYWTRSWLST